MKLSAFRAFHIIQFQNSLWRMLEAEFRDPVWEIICGVLWAKDTLWAIFLIVISFPMLPAMNFGSVKWSKASSTFAFLTCFIFHVDSSWRNMIFAERWWISRVPIGCQFLTIGKITYSGLI